MVRREVQRILIILLSEMGALVLTRPIYILCSEQNRAALDLLDVVPGNNVCLSAQARQTPDLERWPHGVCRRRLSPSEVPCTARSDACRSSFSS
jgi:hypothetical protein